MVVKQSPPHGRRGIWRPFTQMKTAPEPVLIKRGEGALLFDDQGNTLIDAIASWWVNLHGHSHPVLADALSDQARILEHVIFAGFSHQPAEDLATELLRVIPWMDQVFYSDNGSTAVEVGLKMALQYWHNLGQPRPKFVAFAGGYHGDTFGAMSVGDGGTFSRPFEPLLFPTERLAFPNADQTPEQHNKLLQQLEVLCSTGEIAAFIYEPIVQGVAGFRVCSPQVLDEMLNICKNHGVLTIADEVMTGFGRTGRLFASEWCSTKPDIICLSKGITGGTMPLAATLCRNGVFETFLSDDPSKAFYHGHSYTANPLACRVALASLELLTAEACQQQRQFIARRFEQAVEELSGHPKVKSVRAQGCLFALDLDCGEDSYFNQVRSQVGPFFAERGILLRPLGNTLYVLPPYCISDDQLNHIFASIKEFVGALD